MPKYINADFLEETIRQTIKHCETIMRNLELEEDPDCRTELATYRKILKVVQEMPAANVRPIVQGKWLYRENTLSCVRYNHWECSNCGHRQEAKTEHCPHCLAEMET